jgi:hypothetical protein
MNRIPNYALQALITQIRSATSEDRVAYPSVQKIVEIITTAAELHGITPAELFQQLSEGGIEVFALPGAGSDTASPEAAPVTQEWEGLTFRSNAELLIAQALRRAGVLFFANARCLFPEGQDSKAFREADFLVMADGRWGVLEVDGRHWHQDTAADDHHRDRLFKRHGAWCAERFDAEQCTKTPDWVVSEFLLILRRQ